MTTQSQRGYVKEHIARSILKGSFSLLHAGNLRDNEIDYLHFKIDRIENILALSSQVVAIEYSAFQYAMNAKELLAYELELLSQKVLIIRMMDLSDSSQCL